MEESDSATPVSEATEEPPSVAIVTTSAPVTGTFQEPAPVQQHVQQVPQPIKEEPKGPRPISSVPVPGTPWSVVWTSDEGMFFFNASSRMSVWTIPEELANNPQALRIVDEPPGKSKYVGGRERERKAIWGGQGGRGGDMGRTGRERGRLYGEDRRKREGERERGRGERVRNIGKTRGNGRGRK